MKRSQLLSEDTLLGDEADAWNTMLAQDSKADPYEDVVFSHMEKEREQGWITGYFTKRQMDSKFGKGGWKALRRRCIWSETAQKFRMIDNTHAPCATTRLRRRWRPSTRSTATWRSPTLSMRATALNIPLRREDTSRPSPQRTWQMPTEASRTIATTTSTAWWR